MKKDFQSTLCMAIAAFIAIIFTGCIVVNFTGSNAVTARGSQEIYELRVGSFNVIRVEGAFDIHYYASHSDTVTLAVQPNIREHITVEVINNELVARTTRRISFGSGRTPVLTVSTPVLNSVIISGTGEFIAHDKISADSFAIIFNGASDGKAEIDVDHLLVEISGAGDLELSGKANTAIFDLAGAGDVQALELQTVDTTIRLSGAGSVSVSCSERLYINASGAGSIQYRGSPRVNQNISGAVTIRQVD
jgi:hypothetical protein